MKRTSLSVCTCLLLTSCSTGWKENFEEKPVKGYPQASIKKISTLIDKGVIKETTASGYLGSIENHKVFEDGNVCRGTEEVKRMYLMPYEDSSRNYHEGHNLYLVVKEAAWHTHHRDTEPVVFFADEQESLR